MSFDNRIALVVPNITACGTFLTFLYHDMCYATEFFQQHTNPTVDADADEHHIDIAQIMNQMRIATYTRSPAPAVTTQFQTAHSSRHVIHSVNTILRQYSPHSTVHAYILRKQCGMLVGCPTYVRYPDTQYEVCEFVNKTVWIAVVQRAWKRVYRDRIQYLRRSIFGTTSDRFLSTASHSRFQSGQPSIRGMLSALKHKYRVP